MAIKRSVRLFSDIDMMFKPHPNTKDIVRKYNENAIKTSVRNLIMTNFGERLFHPEIGSGVKELLFELDTINTRILLKNHITACITNFEPRVTLHNVEIISSNDGHGYNITIEFTIRNTIEPMIMTLFLHRIR